jgi:diguanylate cyclase (GGDEF)-like protein/PAS domain S-box-containing protein
VAVDPEIQARVRSITGADPQRAATKVELDELTARAFAAVGLDSPAVAAAPVAIYAVDMLGRVAAWNAASEALFGWSAGEIIGEPVPFLPDDEIPGGLDGLERLMAGEVLEGIEYSPVHKRGNRLQVLTSASLLRDENGEPTAILAFAVDLTAKHEATHALDRAHHKWQSLLMNVSDTVTILDEQCRVVETTGEFSDVLGYQPTSWIGTNGFDFIHPDDLPRALEVWEEVLAEPEHEQREVLRMRHIDGHYELIEFSVANLLHDPVVNGIVLTTRNVTPEKQAEALLTDEAAVLELIAQNGPLDESLAAIANLVETHCAGMSTILLLAPGGRELDIAAPGSVPPDLLEAVRKAPLVAGHGPGSIDLQRPTVVRNIQEDPRTATLRPHAERAGVQAGWSTPIVANRTGELLGLIATYYDEVQEPNEHELDVGSVASHLAAIALERDRWQRELFHQARHNQLTGLPNRSLIIENLDAALERARADGSTLAVMFIDLDRFKVVNDSLGHVAGDTLLVRFGGRLSTLIRPGDFVGHFGADEFVVILEHTRGTDDVRFVANRLELSLSEPFGLDEGEVFLSTSIGVALSTAENDTSATLLQHADAAMFRAKELGRDRMEIFDTEMRTRVNEQLRIDRELRLAIERGEFVVHYQPKVDLATGSIIGAEALLRWMHPEHGMVLPGDFLGVAEETGIIVRIGAWVLEQAVAQARAWVEAEPQHAPFLISVNLSARQLGAFGLVDVVRRVLDDCAWPADQLVLELTESILIDDREATLDVLTDLKALGVKLAIDDFGTGFSSLNYLHRFPVDVVKIDRAFVTNIGPAGVGSPVATAILHMAHALGLTTAAEGVEDEGQLAGLRALGCDLAQGFLFERALPPEDLLRLLAAGPRW